MIQFTCSCGHPFAVPPSYAGREGPCPRCGQRVVVPAPSRQPTGQFRGPLAPPPALAAAPVPAPPPGAGPRLEVVHGPPAASGKSYRVPTDRPSVLGRDATADITIPSERVSRRQCRFVPGPGGTLGLEDLGSSNGTLLNQARVNGVRPLAAGDFIQTGDCLFRVVL